MSKLAFGSETLDRTGRLNVGEIPEIPDADRVGLKKKDIAALAKVKASKSSELAEVNKQLSAYGY